MKLDGFYHVLLRCVFMNFYFEPTIKQCIHEDPKCTLVCLTFKRVQILSLSFIFQVHLKHWPPLLTVPYKGSSTGLHC